VPKIYSDEPATAKQHPARAIKSFVVSSKLSQQRTQGQREVTRRTATEKVSHEKQLVAANIRNQCRARNTSND